MYNLNQLWTFMRVAELGSFHKVSREEYISPNAIMKQINNLEDELGGIKLFERTRIGNELTDVGKCLYEDADYILKFCASSQERLMNMAKDDGLTVRIWVSYGSPLPLFQDLWEKINDHFPEIKLHIMSSDNTYDTVKKLWFSLGKSVDIALHVVDKETVNADKYNYIEIMKIPLMVFVSRQHPLSKKDIITAEDLRGETVFALEEGWANNITTFCNHIEEHYPEINIEYKSYYDTDVYNVCANSNKLMLSAIDLMPVHPFIKAIPVDWPDLSSYGLLYSSNPSTATEYFVSAVKTILEKED